MHLRSSQDMTSSILTPLRLIFLLYRRAGCGTFGIGWNRMNDNPMIKAWLAPSRTPFCLNTLICIIDIELWTLASQPIGRQAKHRAGLAFLDPRSQINITDRCRGHRIETIEKSQTTPKPRKAKPKDRGAHKGNHRIDYQEHIC